MSYTVYQQPVLKGTKITAQQFNTQLAATVENTEYANISQTAAQIGFIPSERQKWFRPRVNFKFELDNDTGLYKQKIDSLVIDTAYIQNGEVDEYSQPKIITIQSQEYDRESLENLSSSTALYVLMVNKKLNTQTGQTLYDFFQPEMDQLDDHEKVEKSWILCSFRCDISNEIFYFVGDYTDGVDWFSGGEDAEPYGVFRWQGNTGQTEDETPSPTGTITHCNFLFGRTPIHLNDISGVTDGEWWLEVDHDEPNTASIVEDGGDNTPDITYIPLFTISNQKVVSDWRGAVTIPVWEPSSYDSNSGGGS